MIRAYSVLDFQHPGAAVALATALDGWCYRRLWLGEHHSGVQCANPLMLGSLLAAATRRLRLGSGGASLAYWNPYRLAEDARLIEFMQPGRFDLGVTRGLAPAGAMDQALLEECRGDGGDYHERLGLVHAAGGPAYARSRRRRRAPGMAHPQAGTAAGRAAPGRRRHDTGCRPATRCVPALRPTHPHQRPSADRQQLGTIARETLPPAAVGGSTTAGDGQLPLQGRGEELLIDILGSVPIHAWYTTSSSVATAGPNLLAPP
jgi:Luciferase-like monooxygenase